MNLCDDSRFATIEAAKTAMIKGTNIEDSQEEMKVLDNILFRCWQMGWLDRYEPQMPSNTSNALKALNSVDATQFNALDTISRQDAIEVVQKRPMMLSKEKVLLINDLEKLPPAEPKRITGRCIWCDSTYRIEYNWIDRDGNTASFQDEERHIVATGIAKFCPNCGRKMGKR